VEFPLGLGMPALGVTTTIDVTVEGCSEDAADASELTGSAVELSALDAVVEAARLGLIVSLNWRRSCALATGYVHLIAFSCTGFVAMSAGDAYVKTADPGIVPATSLKAWQLIVLMSTPEEADTMRRPQTVGRSMGGVSIW
jgi:hypothetical protein